jgi:NAD(P)-dependent dehydrogenase (short-subunit alcohol dehydrogenase family)
MLLKNKTALITGGGRGIGYAIAQRFAREGCNIVIADLEIKAADIEALRALGVEAAAQKVDMTDEQQIVALFAGLDRLDILVNNVGTYGPVKKILDMDRAAWDGTFALNLTSTMLCSREAVRKMIAQRAGNIVNIASNVARRGLPYRGCYVSTKWAMLGFTQTLALETVEYGIRVNAVLPGPVLTPHLEEVMELHAQVEGKTAQAVAEDWRLGAPMKRFLEAEEVANVALFLASEQSSAMTGQSLNVTGGFIMT